MIRKIKNFIGQHHLLVFFIFIVSVIIFGSILKALTPVPTTRPVLTTAPTPTIETSAPLELPLLTEPGVQKLTIIWKVKTPDLPTTLPYYYNSTPLINDQLLAQLTSTFGFTNDNLIPGSSEGNSVWTKDNLSLSTSNGNRQLTFTDTSIPPKANFPSTDNLKQTAQNIMNNLFGDKSSSFIIQGNPTLLTADPNNYQVLPATSSTASFAKVIFSQTINNLPYITTSVSNSIVTLIFDSNKSIHYLEIVSGFSTLKAVKMLPVISFQDLKNSAPDLAQKISSSGEVDKENQITNSPEITFTVTELGMAYFAMPQSDYIQPIFLLKGTAAGKNFTYNATYFVPAYNLLATPTP